MSLNASTVYVGALLTTLWEHGRYIPCFRDLVANVERLREDTEPSLLCVLDVLSLGVQTRKKHSVFALLSLTLNGHCEKSLTFDWLDIRFHLRIRQILGLEPVRYDQLST